MRMEVAMAEVRNVSTADQERSIDESMAAWSAHDLDRVVRLLTHDGVFDTSPWAP